MSYLPNLCDVWLKLAQWFWIRWFFNFVKVLSQFRNYLPLEKGGGLFSEQTWIPLTQRWSVPSWFKLIQWFGKRWFFVQIRQCVFAISLLSPLGKGRALYLNKLESPSPKDDLCQVWLNLTKWFLRRRLFLIYRCIFCNFVIISSRKRAGLFIWTNMIPLHQRMICDKFCWNWPSGSGEEDENVKSLQTDRQTNGRTDDGQKVIRKTQVS